MEAVREGELRCMALAASGDHTSYIVKPNGELEIVPEIEKVRTKFENPLILEVQCWQEATAKHFYELGYETVQCSDGSWWITDPNRYLD